MVDRSPKRTDGTLDSYSFRVKRGTEPSHRQQFSRSNLPFMQSEEHDSKFNTRDDIRTMWQTSWADGAFWNKPLISESSIKSYNIAENMDVVSSPGDLIPGTLVEEVVTSGLFHPGSIIQIGDELFAARDAGSNTGIRKWDGSSWSSFTNNFAHTDSGVVAMTYDAANNKIVALFDDGNVDYVGADDSAGGNIIDYGSLNEGANIFFHFGRLLSWNGTVLLEIEDPYGTPTVNNTPYLFNDGMGEDFLAKVSTSAAVNDRLVYRNRTGIATSEGVYLIKNVVQEGLPTAFITRVDRSNNGTSIGAPIATLPPGMVVLDLAYHLGSLIISATSDIDLVINNDLSDGVYPRIDLYHLTQGSLGSIGSPLGGNPDEAPYKFSGTYDTRLYIGGQKRVWTYDPILGGLHPLFEHFRSGVWGGTVGRTFSTISASGSRVLRHFDLEMAYFDHEINTGTDNDSQTRELESNYFDFNIPAEIKNVTHVTLMTDGILSGETWTVSLAADDAAFASVATATSATANTAKQRITPQAGYRFRYKIGYAVTGAKASPSRLKGIVFHALQGEMVSRWSISMDGKEFRNVEGVPIRPETVVANMRLVAVKEEPITYVDKLGESETTYNVKVESVTISRLDEHEIDSIDVVLTEDT